MSKVIRFAALYPNHLNLNGDLGNLTVLQKRLEWAGFASEVELVSEPKDLTHFDFVLLGHGSRDAWAQIFETDTNLLAHLAALVTAGKSVLAVSSGYELLFEILGSGVVIHKERVSEFRDFEGIVGYINTEAQLPAVAWMGKSVLTLFHGPVMAKNPKLADDFLSAAVPNYFPSELDQNLKVDRLADASRIIAFED